MQTPGQRRETAAVALLLALAVATAGLGTACGVAAGVGDVPSDPVTEDSVVSGPDDDADDFVTAEVIGVGWDELTSSPVVVLRTLPEDGAEGVELPIWIGPTEARAISFALHGVEPPRPQTHDLLASLLGELGASMEELRITMLRGGVYFGLLVVRERDGTLRRIDTRPSDGLALALRAGATIRVARPLLDDVPDFRYQPPDEESGIVA